MTFSEVLQLAFSVIGVLALFILHDLKKSVEKATSSVTELNVSVALIIAKTERHDKEIDEMKIRQDNSRERVHELANEINSIHSKIYKE